MKNYFLILALCCAVAFVGCNKEEIEIIPQIPEDMEAAFPDPLFREYVLTNFDSNGDGKISKEEAEAAEIIEVSNTYDNWLNGNNCIKSLRGIQYFANLTYLYCDYNQLTTLDVSKNTQLKVLRCYNNRLSSLNVSTNTQLTGLGCGDNRLTSLDVSKNTELNLLWCYGNRLTTLDVSKTNLGNGNTTTFCPFNCSNMETLKTLYLKKGWSILGITEDNGRDTGCIPAQTKIVFVD